MSILTILRRSCDHIIAMARPRRSVRTRSRERSSAPGRSSGLPCKLPLLMLTAVLFVGINMWFFIVHSASQYAHLPTTSNLRAVQDVEPAVQSGVQGDRKAERVAVRSQQPEMFKPAAAGAGSHPTDRTSSRAVGYESKVLEVHRVDAPSPDTSQEKRSSAPVVMLGYGRLGNLMFEYSLAHYIAQGRPIYLQARWQGIDLFTPLARRCFPNVRFETEHEFLGPLKRASSHDIVPVESREREPVSKQQSKQRPFDWPWSAQYLGKPEKIKESPQQLWSFLMIDEHVNGKPEEIFSALQRDISPQIDAIVMSGFFIHKNFPRNMTLFEIRQRPRGRDQCCSSIRPSLRDVVLHYRAMLAESESLGDHSRMADAPLSWYHRVLTNLTFTKLWIVAQPSVYESSFVKELTARYKFVQTFPHDNIFQALCFIQRAKTFIGSATSTISQMMAFRALEEGAEVYMPVRSLTTEQATAYDGRIKYVLF